MKEIDRTHMGIYFTVDPSSEELVLFLQWEAYGSPTSKSGASRSQARPDGIAVEISIELSLSWAVLRRWPGPVPGLIAPGFSPSA